MTSLLIKDLSLAQPLDRNAASAVRGGDSRLADPGIAPGGCVMPPWAMPELPDFFALLPEWCGTLAPHEPRVPISRPPAHPTLLQ